MRRIHILIICILIFHLFGMPDQAHTTTSSAVSSGLEEQLVELVKQGDVAQPIDRVSRTLDDIRPNSPFDTAIFNWIIIGNASDIQLRVRFFTNNRWGAWQPLTHNPEFAVHSAPRNHYTSTPFELNTLHQQWQVDVIVEPQSTSYLQSVRAITMNNQGANPRRVTLPSAAVRLAAGAKPPIIPRSTWGDATLANWDANAAPWSGPCSSNANTRTWVPDPSEIAPATHVVVHHTAGGNHSPATHNWPASVLGIWRYHAMTLGWCDIGYHYLIDPNGVIYEGRYTGVRDKGNVIDGAHALSYNRSTIGISLMGNFETAVPNPAAVLALENLLAWISTTKNIPLNTEQYYAYRDKTLNTVVGHRDVGQTSCPGRFLYSQLPEIRLRASQKVNKPTDDQWIHSIRADKTTVVAGDTVTFRISIKNIYNTIPISGSAFTFGNADSRFTYEQNQCWALKDGSGLARFPRPANSLVDTNNRFRVIAGYQNWDKSYANNVTSCPVASTIDHPWRWSISTTPLAPGAIRAVLGRIRFTVPGKYVVQFGVIKDWGGYPDTACDRRKNQGACQLKPITIQVLQPTPTYPPYAQTQVVLNTVTHAIHQTEVAATQTRVILEQQIATREVRRGRPTRTATPRINPTPVPAVQTVLALKQATQQIRIANTATAAAANLALSATTLAQNTTQTAIVATQDADNLTATAEPASRTITTTPTTTETQTATATPTITPTSTAIIDGIRTLSFANTVNQLQGTDTNLWALAQTNPPRLFGFDPATLVQQYNVPIDGINATLLSINQHNPQELFVAGRFAWDLVAVQRFLLQDGNLTRTGVWLYQTMGNPAAMVSTGQHLFLTVNYPARGNRAYSELIMLSNNTTLTEAFTRRRLPGLSTALTNVDSGEFVVLAAGQYPNRTGYVVPIQAYQPINNRLIQNLPKPLVSVSARVDTQGLIPNMLIVGSDGATWTRMLFGINIRQAARQLTRQNVQSNPALSPLLLRSDPFASIAIAPHRMSFYIYYVHRNRYQMRAEIPTTGISTGPIRQYTVIQNQLYWHDGTTLYRRVITLP